MKNNSELPCDYYLKPVPDFDGMDKPIGFREDLRVVSVREMGVVLAVDRSDLMANNVIDIEGITSLHSQHSFDQDFLSMQVWVAANDPDMPIVVFSNEELGPWLYGDIVAHQPIRALLCRLVEAGAIEIEGPYTDGSVLLYARDFSLRDYLKGAWAMAQTAAETSTTSGSAR